MFLSQAVCSSTDALRKSSTCLRSLEMVLVPSSSSRAQPMARARAPGRCAKGKRQTKTQENKKRAIWEVIWERPFRPLDATRARARAGSGPIDREGGQRARGEGEGARPRVPKPLVGAPWRVAASEAPPRPHACLRPRFLADAPRGRAYGTRPRFARGATDACGWRARMDHWWIIDGSPEFWVIHLTSCPLGTSGTSGLRDS